MSTCRYRFLTLAKNCFIILHNHMELEGYIVQGRVGKKNEMLVTVLMTSS